MLNLLNFSEGEGTNTSSSIIMYVVLGVLLVAMVLLMILPQRRQKKRTQEMLSKLAIGSIVTTIGGIVGEVVQLDDNHIWISTGLDGEKSTMQFLRQAIHTIAPAPGSPEAVAEAKEEKKEANEEDEIK